MSGQKEQPEEWGLVPSASWRPFRRESGGQCCTLLRHTMSQRDTSLLGWAGLMVGGNWHSRPGCWHLGDRHSTKPGLQEHEHCGMDRGQLAAHVN